MNAITETYASPCGVIVGGGNPEQDGSLAVLKRQALKILTAADADEIYALLRRHEPDILVLNFSMVEQSLEICRVIKDDPILGTMHVMLSAPDASWEFKAIEAGADEYMTFNRHEREFELRMERALKDRARLRSLRGVNHRFEDTVLELARINEEREEELLRGRGFQQSLMPAEKEVNEILNGFGLTCALHQTVYPGAAVSGDFWDVNPMDDGRASVLLADAMGHGIAAALYSLYTLSAWRKIVADGGPGFLDKLDQVLFRAMKGVPLALSLICFEQDSLEFYNGGMEPPILVDHRGARALDHYGPLFAAWSKSEPYVPLRVELPPGSTLVWFSDGIPEWSNKNGEECGPERLRAFAEQAAGLEPQAAKEHLLRELYDFTDGHPSRDDATILIIRRD